MNRLVSARLLLVVFVLLLPTTLFACSALVGIDDVQPRATGPGDASGDGSFADGPGMDARVSDAPADAPLDVFVADAPGDGAVVDAFEAGAADVVDSGQDVVDAGGPDVFDAGGPDVVDAGPLTTTLSLNRQTVDYGYVLLGATAEAAMQVTNTGSNAATALAWSTSNGPFAPDPSPAKTTCSNTLAAGASCYVYVDYAPTSAGSASGSFDVGAGNAPSVVAQLSGNGADALGTQIHAQGGDVWGVTAGGAAIVTDATGKAYALDLTTHAVTTFGAKPTRGVLILGPYAFVWYDNFMAGAQEAVVWNDATKSAAPAPVSYPNLATMILGSSGPELVFTVPNGAGKGADVVYAPAATPTTTTTLVGQTQAPGGAACFGSPTRMQATAEHVYVDYCDTVAGQRWLRGYDATFTSVLTAAIGEWSVATPPGKKDLVFYWTGNRQGYVQDFNAGTTYTMESAQLVNGQLSTSGNVLAYATVGSGGSGALRTTSGATSPPWQVPTELHANGIAGVWLTAPAGDWALVFTALPQNGSSDVTIARLDPANPTLTQLAAYPARPVGFSSDGAYASWLANYDAAAQTGDLYAAPSGAAGVKLTSTSSLQLPALSQGKSAFAFNGNVLSAKAEIFFIGEASFTTTVIAPRAHARFGVALPLMGATATSVVYGLDTTVPGKSGIYVFAPPP